MRFLLFVARAFLLADASMHYVSDRERATGSGKTLIVDVRGPTRVTGDGVRIMGMLMDLRNCGHTVEILSDSLDIHEVKLSWNHAVAEEFFTGVHFWRADQVDSGKFDLSSYSRILVGGKLDWFAKDISSSVVLKVLKKSSQAPSQYRPKMEVFWDDVPFERCLIKPDADELCPRVPALVRQVASTSNKFHVLSVDDRNRMMRDMKQHGIPTENLAFSIWPMSIANMRKALPTLRFNGPSQDKSLVTMMGNLHAVNKLMVTTLFDSGAVGKICSAIKQHGSNVKLMFLGGLADVAMEMQKAHSSHSGCVKVQTGFTSNEELEQVIFPQTRAVLNPFFEDVNSGISVKNFESIMSGVPFLTSDYGMHGLSDEIQGCATFPMSEKAEDPMGFADFIINRVVNQTGYMSFAKEFASKSLKCIQGQQNFYPVKQVC